MKRRADGTVTGPAYNLRMSRKPSGPLKDQYMSDNIALMARAVSLDHTYSSKSRASCTKPGVSLTKSSVSHTKSGVKNRELESRFLKNEAVIPEFCPELTRTSAPAHLVNTSHEEPLIIHGHSIEEHQRMSHAVVDSMLKTSSGRPRPYSLKLGLRVKKRLWKALNCPTILEEDQPDGRIQVKEIFFKSTLNKCAPRVHVDISGEPLSYVPESKKLCP